tara:strand:- start:2383 stop:2634 length:252 start_codon:yes stop_codon:yes gene_type:complete
MKERIAAKLKQVTTSQAAQELTLQGFKPMVSGFDISLQVWNEDLTDSYEIQMSQAHIEWLSSQYNNRVIEANQLMKTEYGIND